MFRKIALIIITFLPWSLKRPVLVLGFGYKLDPTSRIKLAFVDAQNVELGPGARIESLSIVRNLERLIMGKNSKLGTFNWVFGMSLNSKFFRQERNRCSSLTIGDHAAITSRHIIDCIDSVSIGPYSTIAGFRSQLLTHSIDLRENRQSCAPIHIGAYCFIGTGVIILKGVEIPDCTIVAAGSVVTKSLTESQSVYGGNPAGKLSDAGTNFRYFSRETGNVD